MPSPDFEDLGHPVLKESGLKLKTLVKRGVKHFEYVYAFGDYWVHNVEIEGVRSFDAERNYPRASRRVSSSVAVGMP